MRTLQSSSYTNAPSAKKEPLWTRAVGSIAELVNRRWLVWYLISRQLSQGYRESFLGILWIFLGPLLMVGLYTAIFGSLLNLRQGFSNVGVVNYGLYVYCGIIPFLAYSGTVNKAVGIIRKNSSLVQRVVFPLEVLPLTTTAANIINQIFGYAALLVLAALLGQGLHLTTLLIPMVMIPQFFFILGLGYLGAVVGTFLPDVQETLKAVVRISFFTSPIIWPASMATQKGLDWVINYNPIAIIVEAYRALILEGRLPDEPQLLWFGLFSLGLCSVAFLLFIRVKHKFADLL